MWLSNVINVGSKIGLMKNVFSMIFNESVNFICMIFSKVFFCGLI